MSNIAEIEGIGAGYAQKLESAGIKTVETLLEHGASPAGRERIAANAGVSPKLVLRWVNHADLFRIKGVAGEMAELLEAAGVDSVPELAQHRADNLHEKMVAVNETRKLVRRVPTNPEVERWIDQAKQSRRVVQY